jgi:hypothetical protein
MPQKRVNPPSEIESEAYPHTPIRRPIPIPDPLPFDQGDRLFSLCVNGEWMSAIQGVLEVLLNRDTWAGSDAGRQAAVDEAARLLSTLQDCEAVSMVDCCDDILIRLDAIISLLGRDREIALINFRDLIGGEINENGFLGTHPDIPQTTFFNDTGADAAEKIAQLRMAFCWLLTEVFEQAYTDLQTATGKIGAGLFTAAGIALRMGPISWMAGAVIGVIATLGAGIVGAILGALADTDARKDVICCLLDALDGQPVTREAFTTAIDACSIGGNQTMIGLFLKTWIGLDHNWGILLHDYGVAHSLQLQGAVLDCLCDEGEPCDQTGQVIGVDIGLNPPGTGLVIDQDQGACGFGRRLWRGLTWTPTGAICLHSFVVKRHLAAPVSNEATYAVIRVNGQLYSMPVVHSGGDAGNIGVTFDPPQTVGPASPIRVEFLGGSQVVCMGIIRWTGIPIP